MATINIENTITSGSYHKRSTGPTGQVLASTQVEAKLARVEALYREVYGVSMGRMKFYDLVLEIAREGKADVGGYLQYMAQDAAGIILERMHKELGKQVRRKKQRDLLIDAGVHDVYNLRDLARSKAGRKPKKEVA
tara:strand:+ start:471 stop:878 length:408 start_codon:yes stop_codon:yes gene_type:complete